MIHYSLTSLVELNLGLCTRAKVSDMAELPISPYLKQHILGRTAIWKRGTLPEMDQDKEPSILRKAKSDAIRST